MLTEENKTVVRRFVEAWNNKDWDGVLDTFADDFVDHAAPPGVDPGKKGVVPGLQLFEQAFPDLHLTLEYIVAEGDKVGARSILTGTHQGELFGIPPTGKLVRLVTFDISRLENGKQVEHWGVFDQLGMMVQLGVVPPPGGSGG